MGFTCFWTSFKTHSLFLLTDALAVQAQTAWPLWSFVSCLVLPWNLPWKEVSWCVVIFTNPWQELNYRNWECIFNLLSDASICAPLVYIKNIKEQISVFACLCCPQTFPSKPIWCPILFSVHKIMFDWRVRLANVTDVGQGYHLRQKL